MALRVFVLEEPSFWLKFEMRRCTLNLVYILPIPPPFTLCNCLIYCYMLCCCLYASYFHKLFKFIKRDQYPIQEQFVNISFFEAVGYLSRALWILWIQPKPWCGFCSFFLLITKLSSKRRKTEIKKKKFRHLIGIEFDQEYNQPI